MKTFSIYSRVTVSAYTTVTAETVEEAKKIAADRTAVIGGPGSGYQADENWLIEDADGEVETENWTIEEAPAEDQDA